MAGDLLEPNPFYDLETTLSRELRKTLRSKERRLRESGQVAHVALHPDEGARRLAMIGKRPQIQGKAATNSVSSDAGIA